MTLLDSSPERTKMRRHSDPPQLWAMVFSGSLLVNLFCMAGLGKLFTLPIPVKLKPDPITFEFYPASTLPNPGSASSAAVGAIAQANPSANALVSSNGSSPVGDPAIGSILTKVEASYHAPIPDPLTVPAAAPAAPPKSSVAKNNSSSKSGLPNGNPLRVTVAKDSSPKGAKRQLDISKNPNKSDPTRRNDADFVSANHTAAQGSTPPADLAAPGDSAVRSGVQLPAVPDVPNSVANNPGEDHSWNQVLNEPVSEVMPPVPAEFLAQVKPTLSNNSAIASGSALLESIRVPATIKGNTSKMLSADAGNCLLTPDALHGFGQPVIVRVAIDEKGNPAGQNSILIQQPSGNDGYDRLAVCALKTWSFNPAYELTSNNTRLYRPSYLNVEITIRQS